MLRRTVMILVSSLVISGAFASVGAPAHALMNKPCGYRWWRGPWFVQQLIRCEAARWHVSVPTAERVARCESGFRPGAYYHGYAGVYQQSTRYWPARAKEYGFAGWSPYNGRANIIVSIRMVHDGGWGPWSCY